MKIDVRMTRKLLLQIRQDLRGHILRLRTGRVPGV